MNEHIDKLRDKLSREWVKLFPNDTENEEDLQLEGYCNGWDDSMEEVVKPLIYALEMMTITKCNYCLKDLIGNSALAKFKGELTPVQRAIEAVENLEKVCTEIDRKLKKK